MKARKAMVHVAVSEQLELRVMKAFTLSYDSSTSTYTAQDTGGVSNPHFVAYVSGGKGYLQEKDGSGTVVTLGNLGATGLQHLIVNFAAHASYATDSTVPATLAGGIATRIDVNGSSVGDTVIGGAEINVFNGKGGNDLLEGGAGNDTLHGNDGDDQLGGGDGNDFLYGDAGHDELKGAQLDDGEGADHIYVGIDGASNVYANGVDTIGHVQTADGTADRLYAYASDTTSQFYYNLSEGDTLTRL